MDFAAEIVALYYREFVMPGTDIYMQGVKGVDLNCVNLVKTF